MLDSIYFVKRTEFNIGLDSISYSICLIRKSFQIYLVRREKKKRIQERLKNPKKNLRRIHLYRRFQMYKLISIINVGIIV